MARPGRPERNRAARSFRQLRRFHHAINSNKVFGTHRSRPPLASLEDNGSPAIVSHYGGTPHPGDRGAGLGGSCVGPVFWRFFRSRQALARSAGVRAGLGLRRDIMWAELSVAIRTASTVLVVRT